MTTLRRGQDRVGVPRTSFPPNRLCQNANFEVRKANPSFPSPSVIPAKAGIQGWWRGATAAFPRSTPPGFPLSRLCQNATPARHRPPKPSFPRNRPCQNCPLSLWERVGVREPRGKQAGVNGNEWERQGYCGGPHPAFGHPLPEGEGFLGRVAPAFGHPLPEGEGFLTRHGLFRGNDGFGVHCHFAPMTVGGVSQIRPVNSASGASAP